jgi:sensor histidine kinase YesM
LKKLFFLFFIIAFSSIVFAQQPVSIHLTEKDGLPDNEFYNVLEDSKGYIWLAADKGLFRFDGTTYKKFQHTDQIGLSVFQLYEDENDVIWYINLSNQVFYIKDEKITLFSRYSSEFKGNLPNVRIINNQLILANYLKIIIINIETKKIVYKEDYNGFLYVEPTIYNNALYYGVGSNLIKLGLIDFKKKVIPFESVDPRIIQNSTNSLIGKDLIFFVSDKKGFSFYSTNTNFKSKVKKLKYNLPASRIVNSKVIDNKIWYCTKKGVFICEFKNGNLVLNRHLFSNQFVTDIVKDKHANYWFTTVNNNVFIVPNIEINKIPIPLINDKIKHTKKGKENELLLSTINSILYKYTFPSEKIQSYSFKHTSNIFFTSTLNNKYVVYTDLGKYKLNDKLKTIKILPPISSIKDLQNLNSNLTMSAHSSEIRIENTLNKKYIYKKKTRGYKVFYDTINDLRYFATIDGLLVLNKNLKEEEIVYKNKPIYINSIAQTNDGVLWCSSFKNGLFAIKKNKVVYHYTESEGLLSNTNRFIKAKKNNLWIAGDKGIQYFDRKENVFKNLTKNEGIVSYNYNGLEIIDDNVFVSNPEQLIYFNEKNVFKTYNTPEVFFTDVNIGNKKQELKAAYTFKEEEARVSISYSAIGFKTNTSGQFEYRLLGLNNRWISTKNGETNVKYNNLLEGNYTFQIRNINTNITASITKDISFIVTKPFWLKLWFYIVLSFFLLTIISVFYNRKIRFKEKEKNKQLEELNVSNKLINLKLESLRSQMNPHFVFNALNSIQDYIVNNQKNLAADYLGKFADLIRMYLDQSSKKEITLSEEIDTLSSYLELEKLRFEEKLSYTITIQKNILVDDIYIPTALIQPYVENALKHGLLHKKTSGNLSIEFSINPKKNKLVIVIIDNGVGRIRSAAIKQRQLRKHKSFATKATSKRLELLNYSKKRKIELLIEDLDTNLFNVGTKVTIQISL